MLCCISITSSGQASVDKITSSTPIQLLTPSTPIPESFLLDVGIPTFNDGLYLTDDDDLVFPEVRYAESIYFANQLAKVFTCWKLVYQVNIGCAAEVGRNGISSENSFINIGYGNLRADRSVCFLERVFLCYISSFGI